MRVLKKNEQLDKKVFFFQKYIILLDRSHKKSIDGLG